MEHQLENPPSGAHKQTGIALITAMLVAVLVTAGAVALATTQRFSLQRGYNQVEQSQLQRLVQQAEGRAISHLRTDSQKNGVDSLDDSWATEEIRVENEIQSLTAVLVDQQALFNLTNLSRQFGAGTGGGRSQASAQPTPNDDSKAAQNPTAPALSIPQSVGGDPARLPNNANVQNTPAANIPDQPTEKEIFDWTKHQQFIDSYVKSCPDENHKCAQEAIALAFQDSRAAASNPLVQNPNPADISGSNNSQQATSAPVAAAARTANGVSQDEQGGGLAAGSSGRNTISPENQLSALFRALDLDLEPVQAILDWIDEDSETRYPNGAEDEYYTGLDTPYRTANGPFATVRELLLVRGITPEVFEKLAPYLCVLPQNTAINVNTAPAEVLMSIHPMIDNSTAELLINARQAQAFQSTKGFLEHPALYGISLSDSIITTSSDFFSLNSKTDMGDLQTYHQSLMRRLNSKITVLRQAKAYLN